MAVTHIFKISHPLDGKIFLDSIQKAHSLKEKTNGSDIKFMLFKSVTQTLKIYECWKCLLYREHSGIENANARLYR